MIDCSAGRDGWFATVESLGAAGFADAIVVGQAPPSAAGHGMGNIPSLAQLSGALASRGIGWICPIACGDRFAPGAALHYGAVAAQSGAAVVYADDDLVDPTGECVAPHFKPQWNSELFRYVDYVSGAAAWRWEPVADLLPQGLNCALRGAIQRGTAEPVHVPVVLHHRRARPEPQPLSTQLPRMDPVRVSIIIPTRDQAALLSGCLAGVERVAWPDVELIIVDNGSSERTALDRLDRAAADGAIVLRDTGPFNFSRLNNRAVEHASGDLLCLLNNDVEMPDADWLAWLVAAAQRADVGAAGAQLLYADGTIQHAGVVLGVGGGAAHAHRGLPSAASGYFGRHCYPQFVSAVTGACLVVERSKFLAVGGLDERDFPVAFNDVDLCLKLNAKGWASYYEPRARLIHHESKSRGLDRDPVSRARFAGELAALKRKWHTDTIIDRFHHPRLSRFSDQFVLAV
ncbi:glycosyltransferase family 2 protein [Novosphingobium aerophilum]|uniref:glycosyltransferase family 2 protein n=1 Tax=Novosphingobium aerophilum TaxID=2839843 RepID=UPI002E2BDEC4|nr:glycosyltransferase family 2 protein [Novosphingobium aerophilum]